MPIDKLKHAVYWAVLSGITALAATLLGWPQAWFIALFVGVTTAGLWEYYQKKTGSGVASLADFAAGSASRALVALATYVNT